MNSAIGLVLGGLQNKPSVLYLKDLWEYILSTLYALYVVIVIFMQKRYILAFSSTW